MKPKKNKRERPVLSVRFARSHSALYAVEDCSRTSLACCTVPGVLWVLKIFTSDASCQPRASAVDREGGGTERRETAERNEWPGEEGERGWGREKEGQKGRTVRHVGGAKDDRAEPERGDDASSHAGDPMHLRRGGGEARQNTCRKAGKVCETGG